jgi:16S rRNA (adenine1518-N6/adenine1519-N6)-dimethyltransferase
MHAKKSLGQHFLIAPDVARRMVEALDPDGPLDVLEVGPGRGAVTKFLLAPDSRAHPQPLSQGEGLNYSFSVVDIDKRMCEYLESEFPQLRGRVFNEDFLTMDFDKVAGGDVRGRSLRQRPRNGLLRKPQQFQLIGSFPYNISSQIVFRVLENRERIPVVVGMFQREVAKRIVSGHGSKDYGILSVLTQTFYDTRLLFSVRPGSFSPPPKVQSAVVRLRIKPDPQLSDEAFFFRVVKAAFNQRRKMLRNSLSAFLNRPSQSVERFLTKRPEQLSVKEFQELAEILNRT